MALTDTAIRNAKARDKDYKLADSGGLYLLITPAGGKLWRLKFRVDGKERKLALGRYPEISLAKARKQRDAARSQVAQGADPAWDKQRRKVQAKLSAENTFAAHCGRGMERVRSGRGPVDHPGGQDEDAQTASCAPVAAGGGPVSRGVGDYRACGLCLSIGPHPRPAHERQHPERGAAARPLAMAQPWRDLCQV